MCSGLHIKPKLIGFQLGLSQWAMVKWLGRRGLKWLGILPILFEGWNGPPPPILLLHMDGNNLGYVKGKALILQALTDFKVIQEK